MLGHLPGHWSAAAVPTQSSVGVNLVSRAGNHLRCQMSGETAKWLLLCCLCVCQSPEEVRWELDYVKYWFLLEGRRGRAQGKEGQREKTPTNPSRGNVGSHPLAAARAGLEMQDPPD